MIARRVLLVALAAAAFGLWLAMLFAPVTAPPCVERLDVDRLACVEEAR